MYKGLEGHGVGAVGPVSATSCFPAIRAWNWICQWLTAATWRSEVYLYVCVAAEGIWRLYRLINQLESKPFLNHGH